MVKQRIDDRYAMVSNRPWLRVLESSVTRIPERLAEIDPLLFLVFNKRKHQFEVHDAACPIPQLFYVLAAPDLDVRILQRVEMARTDREPMVRAELEAQAERAAIDKRVADGRQATAENLYDLARERAVVKVK